MRLANRPQLVESGYQKLFLGEYTVAAERFGAAQGESRKPYSMRSWVGLALPLRRSH